MNAGALALYMMNVFGKQGSGRNIAQSLMTGDKTLIKPFLDSAGIENPTQEDYDYIADLAKSFAKPSQTSAPGSNPSFNPDSLAHAIDGLVDSPQELLIKAGINALSEGTRAAGNIAKNNGNRLAMALLEGMRSSSAEQEQRYGKSQPEKAAGALAHEKMRKGENTAAITNAISNVIDKTLNTYSQQELARRQTELASQMPHVPAALYDLQGRQATAMDRGQRGGSL